LLDFLRNTALAADGAFPRFFALDWETVVNMIVQFVNLLIIVAILSWLLYKPVRKFLADRRERIAGELAKAAADMKEAEERRTLYEGKLVAISGEREDILEAARKLASQKETEIIQEANGEARLILDRAKLEIEREREKAKDEMRNQIIHVSAMMAESLLGGGMDEAVKNRILNEAIAELGDSVWKG
jgi:F-type H+-transporting ATPase subunit b